MDERKSVVVNIAGDSGDGIQLTGARFANSSAVWGNDLVTFPNFPAEIRAPQGTVHGVSGFQLQFSSDRIYTPGDACDVLVAMNAAATKTQLPTLKKGGLLIANITGFGSNNLRLAKYENNPLEDGSLSDYRIIKVDISKIIKTLFTESTLTTKEKERTKNMFVLGILFWMYGRDTQPTISFLQEKFKKNKKIQEANIKALKAGLHYADTSELFYATRTHVAKANIEPGFYRSVTGNQALSLGLITAAHLSGLSLFYASYPITPASDILHELSKYKKRNIRTFQAEDEIASITSAIGASYGGGLGVTGTSGPGMALKTESIGLAVMLELPLLVCNIQRGGPSTGLPTKTEQSDLLQACYGRNGECPLPVIAPRSPSDCFYSSVEAARIAVESMTPVILLSDGYIANGTEIWRYPRIQDLKSIRPKWRKEDDEKPYYPYKRDNVGVRSWAIPGMKGDEHRIGGLEKERVTGNVSYSPTNHEQMVLERASKVQRVATIYPALEYNVGSSSAKLLLITWGSTYGVVRSVVEQELRKGVSVAHLHLTHLWPLHTDLKKILSRHTELVVVEMNQGQLVKLLRSQYALDMVSVHKIQGIPFAEAEIHAVVKKYSV